MESCMELLIDLISILSFSLPQDECILNFPLQISVPEEFGFTKDRKKLFVYFFGTQQM